MLCGKLYSKEIKNEILFYFYSIGEPIEIKEHINKIDVILTVSLGLRFNVTLSERGLSQYLSRSLFFCVCVPILVLFLSGHYKNL